MMDLKTKNILVGTFSFLLVAGALVGIGVLIYMYRKGRFDSIVNKVKTKVLGNHVHSIRFYKSSGLIDLSSVKLYDKDGNDITFSTGEWSMTAKSYYEANIKPDTNTLMLKDGNTYYLSKSGTDEFALVTPEKPIPKVAKVVVSCNPSWSARFVGVVITIYNLDQSVWKTHTVLSTDPAVLEITL